MRPRSSSPKTATRSTPSSRRQIEAAIAEAKTAIDSGDTDAINAKTQELTELAMKMGQAIYEKEQACAAFARRRFEEATADEEVVDAEFSEVDEDNKGLSPMETRPAAGAPRAPAAVEIRTAGQWRPKSTITNCSKCERTADDKTLKASFRRLAMQCHPDRNPGDHEAEGQASRRSTKPMTA